MLVQFIPHLSSPSTTSYTLSNIVVDDIRVYDYWASSQITALNYSIPSGQSSTFVAASKIDLQNGFHAYSGSEFTASTTEVLSKVSYQNTDTSKSFNQKKVEIESLPITNDLIQNFPNPFNPSTKVNYQLKEDSKVLLEVYTVLGKKVETLVDDYKFAGSHQVNFNGSNLPSGLYICRIIISTRTGEVFKKSNKMLLVK